MHYRKRSISLIFSKQRHIQFKMKNTKDLVATVPVSMHCRQMNRCHSVIISLI